MLYSIDQPEFWWNHITGAHAIVERVALALQENKTVLLKVPSDLPWRYSMRDACKAAFDERMGSNAVNMKIIDEREENGDGLEPGRLLLQMMASETERVGYREKSKMSIQEYIASLGVLKNWLIWVKGLDKASAAKWVKFCQGFSSKMEAGVLFVLETHGDIRVPASGNMELIDFDQFASKYDVQLFNSFILEEQKSCSDVWKQYMSTVAAAVCDVDAELSSRLLEEVNFRTESPITGLQRLVQVGEFERRGEEEGHALWYLRHDQIAELVNREWTAQVQVLFPLIEMGRVQLIKKWESEIRGALRFGVEQYGQPISEPMDVELGTLCYLMRKRLSETTYQLYIPEEEDRNRLRFLHECRNLLAHVCCCSPEQVAGLLDKVD